MGLTFFFPLLNTSAREVGDLVGVVTRSRVLVMLRAGGTMCTDKRFA